MPLTVLISIALTILLWLVLRQKLGNNLIELRKTVKPKQKSAISANRFNVLVGMVGRQDVARKLVKSNLEKYPDRSPSWACNKAISDLEKEKRI